MAKIELNVKEQSFNKDGQNLEYLVCTAIVSGVEIKFYPADSTSKNILKNYIKGGAK